MQLAQCCDGLMELYATVAPDVTFEQPAISRLFRDSAYLVESCRRPTSVTAELQGQVIT